MAASSSESGEPIAATFLRHQAWRSGSCLAPRREWRRCTSPAEQSGVEVLGLVEVVRDGVHPAGHALGIGPWLADGCDGSPVAPTDQTSAALGDSSNSIEVGIGCQTGQHPPVQLIGAVRLNRRVLVKHVGIAEIALQIRREHRLGRSACLEKLIDARA